MPMPKTLRDRVRDDIARGEFYKSACEETFVEAAVQLMAHGFFEDDAIDFLRKLYGAVAEEYGD